MSGRRKLLVRFFENGIVSLNLPVADEVLRARASRTTHPVAIHLLKSLCSAVTARDFAVDNPYLFKTKTEVVTTLSTHKAAHLIPHTCSCAHSMFKRKTQGHCGGCSQCIDRRFAITAAGLLAYDPEADYVSDVFIGPRKEGPEKNMAVDYARHGIELWQRSQPELAALFNAELTRAVRYEPKRSEAAERLISMHKRHGDAVFGVLQQKTVENAAKLVEGAIDDTSMLALVIGKKHLEHQRVAATSPEESPEKIKGAMKSAPSIEPQNTALAKVEDLLQSLLAKFSSVPAAKPIKRGARRKLGKRDTVIFAAILMGLRGIPYCSFLQDHGLRPRWPDSGPAASYPNSYRTGDPWRKKVQDEKTRAKLRMTSCDLSELATALNTYLPKEFDQITPFLHSRNSLGASKSSNPRRAHKY